MRGGKRQACGLLPRSGKATRSGAAKPQLQAEAQQPGGHGSARDDD